MVINTDFLVIGSGIAGLTYAMKVSELGQVTIITKKNLTESNTNYAQGGIASVIDKQDSFDLHIEDTLKAGAGFCNSEIVDMVVRNGPECIRDLIDLGVRFSRKEKSSSYDLGREGGHSKNRVIHCKDKTGREVELTLSDHVRQNKNIRIIENHVAIDLISESDHDGNKICRGVYALDAVSGDVITISSKVTILATGGAGKAYLYTSNPDIATGDGMAMAYRAGARMANMEFVQFHPTCLYHPEAKNFLISEAVRGEGGILVDASGNPFMHKYDPLKDLACRDVVARSIDTELKKHGDDSVFLNISHKDPDIIKNRFPTIYKKCLEYGIDITKDPIPVVPAAHYICGGIMTDKNGKTDIKNLYAIGETACTGLHGANRLASNSLLEALVFARNAAVDIISAYPDITSNKMPEITPWDDLGTIDSDEHIMVSHNWDEIRRLMWNYVGVVRSDKRLERALRRIKIIQKEIHDYYWDFKITSDLIELRNIAQVADLIIRSAMIRKESRGLHYNIGYLDKDDNTWLKDTVLINKFPGHQS